MTNRPESARRRREISGRYRRGDRRGSRGPWWACAEDRAPCPGPVEPGPARAGSAAVRRRRAGHRRRGGPDEVVAPGTDVSAPGPLRRASGWGGVRARPRPSGWRGGGVAGAGRRRRCLRGSARSRWSPAAASGEATAPAARARRRRAARNARSRWRPRRAQPRPRRGNTPVSCGPRPAARGRVLPGQPRRLVRRRLDAIALYAPSRAHPAPHRASALPDSVTAPGGVGVTGPPARRRSDVEAGRSREPRRPARRVSAGPRRNVIVDLPATTSAALRAGSVHVPEPARSSRTRAAPPREHGGRCATMWAWALVRHVPPAS
jgi:hypothetical protein